ncbi:uncharacterized protein LOC132552305 [Ylistrum balloti]|uniref:uncharacterized protein LOC132552305 n=1 Tax=Ylistrum balloti TaxID=509963 RepID=UPI002905ABDE|nr:uncharacterized protein LOC132552305 [Ylistrum balloti]
MSTKEGLIRVKMLVTILLLLTGHTSSVNFSNIIQQYTLICGQSHICNSSTFTNISYPTRTYEGPIFCPKCACDQNCMQREDCCPDILFPHSALTCLNLALYEKTNVKKYALAVAECPTGSPDELSNRCSGNYTSRDKLTLTPVSSTTSLTVYRNRFCAECFGEANTSPWSLSIDCPGMIDLNHLTSYDIILETINESACSMVYRSPNRRKYVGCDSPELREYRKVEVCNITGAWRKHDPDIEWACRTVDQPYKYYRNIFCFLCNPGQHRRNDHVIDRCNQTGAWGTFDKDLKRSCEQLTPTVPESYPFKNIFCFLCNRNTNSNDIFMDAKIEIESEKYYREKSSYSFKIKFFTNLNVQTQYQMDPFTARDAANTSSIVRDTVRKVDLRKLLFMHFLHYGHQTYCNKSLSFYDVRDTIAGNLTECGCDVTCVLTSDCCADFAITSPAIVQKNIAGFVVSKCYNITEISYLLVSCESNNEENFANIPITSTRSNVVYRNIYCFLCNEGQDMLQSIDHTKNIDISLFKNMYNPINLKLVCNFLMKYEEYYLLSEFIKAIEHIEHLNGKEKCSIHFPLYKGENMFQVRTVSTCNVTGQWEGYDPDVLWACENYIPDITQYVRDDITGYSNIFCKICNTNSSHESPIDTCDRNGHIEPMDIVMATRCEVYPRALSKPIYKNTFCSECYTVQRTNFHPKQDLFQNFHFKKQEKCNEESIIEMASMVASTYRKMFTFRGLTDNSGFHEANNTNFTGRCQKDEVFDPKKDVCRQLFCSDGKYISGNACRPFLPHTTLLGYTLAVRVEVTFAQNSKTVGEVIEPLRHAIRDFISKNLKIMHDGIEYVSIYLFTHQGCDSVIDPTGHHFLLHTSFFLPVMVERLEIESKLVNMTSSYFSTMFLNTLCNVTLLYDEAAVDLPTTIHTTDLKDSCFVVSYKKFGYTSNKYKMNYVSKFLACQQVEIDHDQYESDPNTFSVKLLPKGPRLHFGEFRRTGSYKRIQVCIEDFEKMMTSMTKEDSVQNSVKYILQVMSFVCVCLSVLGLFATFLTYCFFSSLRTLPGKNNMCLIASLFFSQFLTQLGISQPKDKTLCATFGLLIHYFWLATFFSMNVCSYHMFQVFVLPLNQVKNMRAERLRHIRYLSYCLVLPAFIIAMYVTISVSETGSIGYGSDVKCFISSLPAFIATFIGPVFVICLANIVFFSITVYHISKVPHVSSNKSSRREVSVHIKLFLLTGISWIFQLIDSFVPVSIFSVIVNFVNGSQGIFIFVAYSVNSRVRSFYKDSLSFRTSSSVNKSKTSSSDNKHSETVTTLPDRKQETVTTLPDRKQETVTTLPDRKQETPITLPDRKQETPITLPDLKQRETI